MSHCSRLLRVACFTAIAVVSIAARAQASLISITTAAFSPSAQIAHFTVGSSQPLPYSEVGATFASFSGLTSSVLSFNNFLFMAGSGTLRVNFSAPEIRAGFLFTNDSAGTATLSVQAFSDLAGTLSIGTLGLGSFNAGQGGFVGFQGDALFSRVDISFSLPSSTASYRIDDFRFEPTAVPEPTTVVLTLLGVGWLGTHARRLRR